MNEKSVLLIRVGNNFPIWHQPLVAPTKFKQTVLLGRGLCICNDFFVSSTPGQIGDFIRN